MDDSITVLKIKNHLNDWRKDEFTVCFYVDVVAWRWVKRLTWLSQLDGCVWAVLYINVPRSYCNVVDYG